ncbi:acyl-CoA dehydrogenase family protein [Ancylobacter sp. 6x-1]|uniref:Acyl-CoA dehydrogenase family protein n=1 Tax=Ancylobacter crimeensis TaxID=2579147 RepID=A0ABT0DFI1_9HYPH|nr:acyl-CoA dehydrogenase family protein [Ancylobacter crimeensis]MCK0198713.1 acyl-CoA dehydrogenase family protein [Ancylobacter crimeensis]
MSQTESEGQIESAWGAGPSARYEALAEPFRPVFARIAEGARARELNRTRVHEPIRWLKEAGFTAVRLPVEAGGQGASLPELANLLIELSAADSNVTQALRVHFGVVEDILNTGDDARRARWLLRIAAGETTGSAWTEAGGPLEGFGTRLTETAGGLVVNGTKYYTTGSLYADWIDLGVAGPQGEELSVFVRTDAPGVAIVDDWDGFGQIASASGTTTFTDVPVAREEVVPDAERFRYSAAFYQLYHLATLAGIGRAVTAEVAGAVKARTRTYTHANGPRSAADPQVLAVVGRIRGAAYAAGAIALKAAESLQRAFESRFAGDEAAEERANAIAELETAQAQTVVTNLILDGATTLFDALGASATRAPLGLDRHWRNVRTLSSHNPRIYKDRIVGDFAVNGTLPPYQWRIGQPHPQPADAEPARQAAE